MLKLLVKLKASKIPLNQALVLLYVKDNPEALQKNIAGDLGLNRNVLCAVLQLMIAKRQLIESGSYHSKAYTIAPRGEIAVQSLE